MSFALCTVPAAPVRSEPSHRVEMVNQLLFGDQLELIGEKEEWVQVRALYDGYEGWVTNHMLTTVNELPHTSYYTTEPLATLHFDNGRMLIPAGSALPSFHKETGSLWDESFHYRGECRSTEDAFSIDQLIQQARGWLNAPYLWGGKTVLGVDCSGFVQTLFKPFGIQLLRDAWQQAGQGQAVDGTGSALPGDLCFFQNEKGRITHVGMVLDKGEIIHASGKVRIDRLNDEGIFRSDDGRRTHVYHSTTRMIPGK